jgi:hypothetical protein
MIAHRGSGRNVKEEDEMPHWGVAFPEVVFILFTGTSGRMIP